MEYGRPGLRMKAHGGYHVRAATTTSSINPQTSIETKSFRNNRIANDFTEYYQRSQAAANQFAGFRDGSGYYGHEVYFGSRSRLTDHVSYNGSLDIGIEQVHKGPQRNAHAMNGGNHCKFTIVNDNAGYNQSHRDSVPRIQKGKLPMHGHHSSHNTEHSNSFVNNHASAYFEDTAWNRLSEFKCSSKRDKNASFPDILNTGGKRYNVYLQHERLLELSHNAGYHATLSLNEHARIRPSFHLQHNNRRNKACQCDDRSIDKELRMAAKMIKNKSREIKTHQTIRYPSNSIKNGRLNQLDNSIHQAATRQNGYSIPQREERIEKEEGNLDLKSSSKVWHICCMYNVYAYQTLTMLCWYHVF